MNVIDSRLDSFDGRSARRKAYTYKGQHQFRINADIHASSRIRIHDLSGWTAEDISCLRPRVHCDRPNSVIK
jgi:hypothetical protein